MKRKMKKSKEKEKEKKNAVYTEVRTKTFQIVFSLYFNFFKVTLK